MLDRLERADRTTELMALACVGGGRLEHALHASEHLGTEHRSGLVERSRDPFRVAPG